jgi:hypothetical protein
MIKGFFGAGGLYHLEIGLLQERSRQASHFEVVFHDQGDATRLDLLSHTNVSYARAAECRMMTKLRVE